MTELESSIGLAALVDSVGARNLGRLLAALGSARAVWSATRNQLAVDGCAIRAVERFIAERGAVDIASIMGAIDRNDISVIARDDRTYPTSLTHIPDPPIALFVRGNHAILHTQSIAVIGTRTATAYGRSVIELLIGPLVRAGLTITSGLAYGIDGYAHDACLRANGATIAVLGTGVDPASISPSAHRGLAERIIASGGCIVSEYVPETPGLPMHFPARNRIAAGLSIGTLVIEAPEDSGALITAEFAMDFGREVFVVPGPITSPMSVGTNALLKNGATPVTNASDVIDALHLREIIPPATTSSPIRQGIAGRILEALITAPLHVDAIRDRLDVAAPELTGALTTLELDGAVRDIGGGTYTIVKS